MAYRLHTEELEYGPGAAAVELPALVEQVEETLMSVELSQLEQAWLAAETQADEARQALRLSEELARRQLRGEGAHEADVVTLASKVAVLRARQEEAERTASAAFDRFWSARNSAGQAANTAHA
jgi:transcription elongation GreA/GreB family factor